VERVQNRARQCRRSGGGETSGASVPGAPRGIVSSRQASSALLVRGRAELAVSVPPLSLYNQEEGGSLPPAHTYTPPSPLSHVPPSYSPHYSSSHQVSPQAVPSRFRTTLSSGAYRPLSTPFPTLALNLHAFSGRLHDHVGKRSSPYVIPPPPSLSSGTCGTSPSARSRFSQARSRTHSRSSISSCHRHSDPFGTSAPYTASSYVSLASSPSSGPSSDLSDPS
jgi:hypothetical protein